jgi:hypothetical protein
LIEPSDIQTIFTSTLCPRLNSDLINRSKTGICRFIRRTASRMDIAKIIAIRMYQKGETSCIKNASTETQSMRKMEIIRLTPGLIPLGLPFFEV